MTKRLWTNRQQLLRRKSRDKIHPYHPIFRARRRSYNTTAKDVEWIEHRIKSLTSSSTLAARRHGNKNTFSPPSTSIWTYDPSYRTLPRHLSNPFFFDYTNDPCFRPLSAQPENKPIPRTPWMSYQTREEIIDDLLNSAVPPPGLATTDDLWDGLLFPPRMAAAAAATQGERDVWRFPTARGHEFHIPPAPPAAWITKPVRINVIPPSPNPPPADEDEEESYLTCNEEEQVAPFPPEEMRTKCCSSLPANNHLEEQASSASPPPPPSSEEEESSSSSYLTPDDNDEDTSSALSDKTTEEEEEQSDVSFSAFQLEELQMRSSTPDHDNDGPKVTPPTPPAAWLREARGSGALVSGSATDEEEEVACGDEEKVIFRPLVVPTIKVTPPLPPANWLEEQVSIAKGALDPSPGDLLKEGAGSHCEVEAKENGNNGRQHQQDVDVTVKNKLAQIAYYDKFLNGGGN